MSSSRGFTIHTIGDSTARNEKYKAGSFVIVVVAGVVVVDVVGLAVVIVLPGAIAVGNAVNVDAVDVEVGDSVIDD